MIILNKSDCVLLSRAVDSCLRVSSILNVPEMDLIRLNQLKKILDECPDDIEEDSAIEDPEILI